jgi:hypothetical protein
MGYHEHIWFHQCQEDSNSLYHFERIPENIPGAYVSLESELIRYIKYHVNPETDKIKIKISGDRSKVSRIFYGPYSMDKNNYIEIHPTQAQVAKVSYHHPTKYLNQNVSP